MPICSKCKEDKSVEEFYRDPSRPNGLSSYCKPCKKVYHHKHHQGYRDRRRVLRKAMRPSIEEKVHKMAVTIKGEQLHDRDRARDKFRAWRYGLTEQEFQQLCEIQHWKCAICDISLKELKTKDIHIDHDHATGDFRGILCRHCNALLGFARDNTIILVEAIRYLHQADRVP